MLLSRGDCLFQHLEPILHTRGRYNTFFMADSNMITRDLVCVGVLKDVIKYIEQCMNVRVGAKGLFII
jgi:hypothetical protein